MNSRRKFLKTSATAIAGLASIPHLYAGSLKKVKHVGIQLFTIPQMVAKDFKGTMQKLAAIGYKEIEFFGPYEFSAQETIDRWKGLGGQMGITSNAFYGYKAAEAKALLKDLGLTSPSAHLDMISLRTNLAPAMEGLAPLGVKYVVIPAFMNSEKLNEHNRIADELSSIGEKTAKYGITLVYHNHGYEHVPVNGQTLMDALLTQTNSNHVKFELDVFWMSAAGASPVEYLNKYPGRFKLMHVKDATEHVRFSGDGSTPDQWMAVFGKMADPGKGVFDLKGIINAAKKSGVEHFIVEKDLTKDADKTLNDSFTYLSQVLQKTGSK